MSVEQVSPEEQVRAGIIKTVINLAATATNQEVTWHSTIAESPYRRFGHALIGINLLTEARLCWSADPPGDEPLELMNFWLPDRDLPDGTPTQRIYFVKQDGTIEKWQETAEITDEVWADFEDLAPQATIDEVESRALLDELRHISL